MLLAIGLWTFARALVHGSAAVALENVALRHQLAVLQRSVRRPKLHRSDRVFWVGFSRLWRSWRSSLVIVQPATVLAWHLSFAKTTSSALGDDLCSSGQAEREYAKSLVGVCSGGASPPRRRLSCWHLGYFILRLR